MHLKPSHITHVKGNNKATIKRSLVEFRFSVPQNGTEINELVLEKERHVYTDDYLKLVKDFYLKL